MLRVAAGGIGGDGEAAAAQNVQSRENSTFKPHHNASQCIYQMRATTTNTSIFASFAPPMEMTSHWAKCHSGGVVMMCHAMAGKAATPDHLRNITFSLSTSLSLHLLLHL